MTEKRETIAMVRKVMTILILAALLEMALWAVPALAAGQGSQAADLLIYGVFCAPTGAFSAEGFASKDAGSVFVTIDFVGICSDGQVLTLTYSHAADLFPLVNPNARPNGKSQGRPSGYRWSVDDGIATIPEFGAISWSATHIKVTSIHKTGSVTKETDLPLPYSPF